MEKGCIFCDAIRGKIDTFMVYEDKEHLAFLDIYPNTKGQTLVVTKEHIPSDFLNMSNEKFIALMTTSKTVANLIKQSLSAVRVFLIIEGMEIDHIHIKLYPAYKIQVEESSLLNMEKVYFHEYKGYLTTLHGPKAKSEELSKMSAKIRSTYSERFKVHF